MIRPGTPADAGAVAQIWNRVITETTITFNPVPKSDAEVAALIAAKAEAGLGFLVCEVAGQVAGFATYGQFRAGEGYRHTAEHSILLAPAAHGRGLGRALMAALSNHAAAAGYHSLWAGVSAENPAGLAFHRAVGFSEIATLPEVGFKFGRWIDLVLMQKRL